MTPAGPSEPGPKVVAWDEAREVVALILAISAALMVLSPIAFRMIDGQLDRPAFRSALTGAGPTTGLVILAAGVLVATTPAIDVTPRLRAVVFQVAVVVLVVAMLGVFDALFADSAGGVRRFFNRFPTILRFPAPAALMSGSAAWLARRVVPFPGG